MTVFAIVDCNNFYVSCERVFAPSLNGKPVLVLSNNDGCAVARSNEVKKLGIGMGAPIFKQKAIIEKHGIQVFSSNYALYGDMSRRVVHVLSEFCDDLEVYSIDESFLDITATRADQRTELGRTIRATVKKHTGIPVSVGMAHTKTLSKIAVRLAKKSPKADGVLDLTDSKHHDRALELTPVEDVWGVGWRYARFLKVHGITNARQLRDADKNFIKKKMGVNGTRLIEELKGVPCYPLDKNPSPKKNITVSRSFGKPVSTLSELREAVATYATRAAEKLRNEHLTAGLVTVFIMTDRFKPESFYYNTKTLRLDVSTSNSPEIIRAALTGLEEIFRKDCLYKKAGLHLSELSPDSMVQTVMFDPIDRERSAQLMASLDKINAVMGKDTLSYASAGMKGQRPWQVMFNHRSNAWTTRWDQLPIVT